ncbi:universal stress protein [Oceanicola sp. 502str15]|uniref:universal stress protein n=1 Tax=Oceanicola sp. 502str15 TaxID=2696061 RepID=UPI00209630FF|nr:universal stress protein [Oceanicola sp. 502str15]MCO6384155.1 universal stress protein [Oceanicola sp. 502str15]
MSSETFIVAYEGKEGDTPTLDYAMERASKDGASLLIVHILEWSPYSFLTPEEIEERHGRRKQEMSRAKEIVLDPAVARAQAAGLEARCELRYGSVVDKIVEIASETGASMIFVGRAGSQSIAARVFGSVPIGLAQVAPVPTVIVP